jgi:hypothetical protein
VRLEARGQDQPRARLGLLLGVLDDDEVVERLECQPRGTRIFQHDRQNTPGNGGLPFIELGKRNLIARILD